MEIAENVRTMDIEMNLWKMQNFFFKLLREVDRTRREQAGRGEAAAQEWLRHFGGQPGFKTLGANG